jgi:hypothetical protein
MIEAGVGVLITLGIRDDYSKADRYTVAQSADVPADACQELAL